MARLVACLRRLAAAHLVARLLASLPSLVANPRCLAPLRRLVFRPRCLADSRTTGKACRTGVPRGPNGRRIPEEAMLTSGRGCRTGIPRSRKTPEATIVAAAVAMAVAAAAVDGKTADAGAVEGKRHGSCNKEIRCFIQ